MPTFEHLWSLLYDHGAANYYKHECSEIWSSLTPQNVHFPRGFTLLLPYFYRTFIVLSSSLRRPFFEFQGN